MSRTEKMKGVKCYTCKKSGTYRYAFKDERIDRFDFSQPDLLTSSDTKKKSHQISTEENQHWHLYIISFLELWNFYCIAVAAKKFAFLHFHSVLVPSQESVVLVPSQESMVQWFTQDGVNLETF